MDIKKIDPLYTIFEQHLFNFQDPNADRKSFILGIVKEYITHMRKMGLSVPMEWEDNILEELFFQVNTMLVKKIYGCLTLNEFIAKAPPEQVTKQKRKARENYRAMTQAVETIEQVNTQLSEITGTRQKATARTSAPRPKKTA
jgi:hypothetical protein